jgi:diguanylate cyclase (GGDEF)-like protein/PAS domain S-box-containing protein
MIFQDIGSRVSGREMLKAEVRVAQGVVDHLLEGVFTTDTAGVIKTANARALRMFGYSAEEMQRMTVARLLPVPFMNTPGLKLTDYIPGGQARMPKLAGWRKDATTFPAELVVETMQAGSEERLVVIICDITERLRSQSLAQRLGRLLDAASEEVYIFDAQSLYFIEVNKGARRNLGLKSDQLARMSLASIATDLDSTLLQGYLARLRGGETEHVSYKTEHRRSDGSTYPVEVRLSFSRDEEPPVYMAIALDITERESAEKRMRQLAHYDALTNLPNRTLLFDRLKQAMLVARRTGRQLAVLFLDLDGFKPINDVHGHEAGDSVLQAVADRLNAGLRAADTVSRFGGDEFVVLAHGQRDTDDALALAAKVHEVFRPPFEVRGQKVVLTASIGITLFPADPSDAEGLLRHADAAMYQSKQQGPGCSHLHVLADPAAKPREPRGDLGREITAGLTTRQFQLQFWPVVGAGGLVTAALADFYWMHPEYGRVDSRETLNAARRAGLHAGIEAWLLEACAAQYRGGQQQGLPMVPVLFPLSARQWRDPEFPDRLSQLMERASTPLKLLVPLIDGSEWAEAASAIQMLWSPLLQHGLRLAVSQPAADATLDGVGLIVLPHADQILADGATGRSLVRRYAALDRPLLVEGVSGSAEWERLRGLGISHGVGAGLQGALTPLEYASWIAQHGTRPL